MEKNLSETKNRNESNQVKGITEKGLYSKLPDNLKNDLKHSNNSINNNEPFVQNYIKTILKTPTTYSKTSATLSTTYNEQQAEMIYEKKVEKRKQVPLENPPLSDLQKQEKTRKKKERKMLNKAGKKGVMSRRERKKSGIWEIPMEARKYQLYIPLHQLWEQYMNELLGDITNANYNVIYPKLLKADFHGSIITIVQSKCPTYIGKTGILVKETENTFNIITESNRLLVIPKANSIFTIKYQKLLFTIYGNNFRVRSGDRITKKFKLKNTIDL